MTTTSATAAGRLPLELERYTFELAAEIYPKAIPALLRVAHRVRVWIEPLLYAVLRLDNAEVNRAFLKAVKSKPAPFLASTVRHLLLYSSMETLEAGSLESFLESASGIIGLSLVSSVGGSRVRNALGAMRIQRLSVDMAALFSETDTYEPNMDLAHPLFRAVTHLDLFDDINGDDGDDDGPEWLQQLSKLPVLTHLGVNSAADPAVLRGILASCTSLTVLLVAFNKSEVYIARTFMLEAEFTDARVVVGMYEDYYADWELGARGGDDIWVRAERFVARKKLGEIEANEYFMNAEGEAVPPDFAASEGNGAVLLISNQVSDDEASAEEDYDDEESTAEETD